jgi:hypothetical protein
MYSNPLNVTIKEVSWLSGIIEGEAHIGYYKTPKIKIKMTDRDIIERVARLFRCNINEFKEQGYKISYSATASGYKAIEWLFTTYSFLGNRRKYEALNVINEWKKVTTYQRNMNRFSINGVMYCRIHGSISGANRVNVSRPNTYKCYGCTKDIIDRIRKSVKKMDGVN